MKGLFRNIDLIELGVGKAVLGMAKPGIGFCFKVSLERKKTNHGCDCWCVLFTIQTTRRTPF